MNTVSSVLYFCMKYYHYFEVNCVLVINDLLFNQLVCTFGKCLVLLVLMLKITFVCTDAAG